MLHDFDQILKAALALPPGARAMLADHLLASLDGPTQKEIDAAWAEEIERRVAAFDRGEMPAYPAEDVFAEALRLLR